MEVSNERVMIFREKQSEGSARSLYTMSQRKIGRGPDETLWIDWIEWEGPLAVKQPDIISKISSGNLVIGDRIPSEYELARILDLNKSTANKAVTTLVHEGILTRGKQGSGTFVRQTTFKGTIMFISPIKRPFSAEIVSGAQSTALAYGYLHMERRMNRKNKKNFQEVVYTPLYSDIGL